MDRKSIIILVLSFGLIFFWGKLTNHLYPPPPKSTNTLAVATNAIVVGTGASNAVSTNASSTVPASKLSGPEETIAITNNNGVYTFTSQGGGLKVVEFRKYRSDVQCGATTQAERRPATLNMGGRAPVLSLAGAEALLGPEIYSLTRTESGVRAERTSENGLQIVKTFTLSDSNYLVKASLRFENRSQQAIPVPQQEILIGASTPMSAQDDGQEMGVFYFDGKDAEHVDGNLGTGFGCGGKPKAQFVSPVETTNIGWSAVHNRFFAIGVIPSQPAQGIVARRVELDHSKEFLALNPKAITNGLQAALVYPATNLLAGASVEKSFTIYAGPKEYNTLAQLGEQMKNKFDAIMNFGFFRLFAQGLLLSMNQLHAWGLSYGLAIVLITIIIKLLFWPLTNASTKSMKRMQLLQPQMKAIQEKYKDDPRKMNMKVMEFMKEHKVSPLGGCLPMVIQIPIFMGFYSMLRSAIELRGESFLWACDLSQADTVMFVSGFPINPMPVIWGVTMLVQASMTPASPGMDPAQQKIMKYMPLMILIFLYKMPAGLTLYWIVQNLLTILQMKLTKAVDVTITAPAKGIVSGSKKKK